MRKALALAALVSIAAALVPVPASAGKFKFPDGVASGDVTKRSALLWTRTSKEARLRVQVATDKRFRDVVSRANVRSTEERDLTVEVKVRGLHPGEHYFYRFIGPGGRTSRTGQFDTAPRGSNVTFVYSGDSDGTATPEGVANFRDEVGSVMAAARLEDPDFFVYLGDTIYSDSGLAPAPADDLAEYRAKYREVRSIAAAQRFLSSTSVVAMWDDHEVRNDYAGNPGGAAYPPGIGALIPVGQQAFREYFPIQESPDGALYRRLRWGKDLELFVLDQRSYRTTPVPLFVACDTDGNPANGLTPDLAPTLPQVYREQFKNFPGLGYFDDPPQPGCLPAINSSSRTMLGAAQESWLKDALLTSTATFKVIVNEVPIQELYANPYDRWEAYASERAELLDFIADNNVQGVFFATTDTHASIANPVCAPTLDSGTGAYVCDRAAQPWELIAGPLGTNTFAAEVESVIPGASDEFETFMSTVLDSPCTEFDEPSFATVEVNAKANTLKVTPKRPTPGNPVPVCSPIVLTP